jgi:hypothetical protein
MHDINDLSLSPIDLSPHMQCIGQELDQFENVVFAVSASLPAATSKKTLPPKQKLSLVVLVRIDYRLIQSS